MGLIRVLRPDSREAIRLQLETHAEVVGFGFGGALALGSHLRLDAQQVLDVMAHFMGEHVCLGELARSLKLLRQLVEETEVEVNLAVTRAVKGTHGRARVAAGGRDAVPVEHQPRWRVLAAAGLKDRAPDVLGLPENRGDELPLGIAGNSALRRF